MTVEEIKTYVDKIESTPIQNLNDVLSSLSLYDIDITMSKICDALAENINILRNLNRENDQHLLDEEICDLLRKYYLCVHYLDYQNEIVREKSAKGHRIVFAKTPAGKPYFNIDLAKVPKEAYKEVSDVMSSILDGVNMSDNTKVKYYNYMPDKVLEFKGFQVRIYTTRLKGNILCVFGLKIKKDDNPKSIHVFVKDRIVTLKKQIENYRRLVKDPDEKKELLLDSENILSNIMDILNNKVNESEGVELLFPSDEELEQLVPYKEEAPKALAQETKSKVPKTSKMVKRRTRGLGKKTIARNDIMASLKGLSLEELIKIQNFITRLKMDKGLNVTIGDIYEGFLNMSSEQIQSFESSIKDFKKDNIGRSQGQRSK